MGYAMKISELAKSQDLSTEEVMKVLDSLGIRNKKSSSKLNEKELDEVRHYIEENVTKKPEVALIKKKPKAEEEEHKKIVIKKKKVIILKKPHKGEPAEKAAVVPRRRGRRANRRRKKSPSSGSRIKNPLRPKRKKPRARNRSERDDGSISGKRESCRKRKRSISTRFFSRKRETDGTSLSAPYRNRSKSWKRSPSVSLQGR